jgi:hypothetical protein
MDNMMKYDQILWNDVIPISNEDYFKKYDYLFDTEELLSSKLKKYNPNSAKNDLQNGLELTPYHGFIAKARDFISGNITVFKLKNDLIDVIQTIDVSDIANEPPVGLKNPLIIETNDLNANLFGDINSIILYYHKLADELVMEYKAPYLATIIFHTKPTNDNNWYKKCIELNEFTQKNKIRFLYAGGNLFSFDIPTDFTFGFSKIDYKRNVLMKNNFCEHCACKDNCDGTQRTVTPNDYIWCYKGLVDNILSFILIFLYLMEADNTPIQEDRKTEHTSYMVSKKGKIIEKKFDWYTKYLYLNKPKPKYEKIEEKSELNRDGLISKPTWVKGHNRYQACGPGLCEHKLIAIKPYLSSRMSKDNDTKIITGIK